MLFLQTFMKNLVLTKSSGPKRNAVAFTTAIFAGFCVCHTDLSGGGGAGGGEGRWVWRAGYTPADRQTSGGVLHHPCTVPVYKLLLIRQ
jgi:hypothetical protein